MNFVALFEFINISLSIYLGAAVYYRDSSSRINRVFLYYTVIAAYTSMCEYFGYFAVEEYDVHFWYKASFLWPFLPAVFLKLVLELTNDSIGKKRIFGYAVLPAALVISFLHLFTDILYLGASYHHHSWEPERARNILTYLVMAYGSITGFSAIFLILRYYFRQKEKRKKSQALLIAFGVAIAFITRYITEAVIPLLGPPVPPLTAFSFLIGTVFLYVSLSRYKLFLPDPSSISKQLFATSKEYFIVFNHKMEILLSSRSFLEDAGYGEEDVIGKRLKSFIPFFYEESILSGLGKETEYKILTGRGEHIPVSVIISSVFNYSNKEKLYVMFGRDLRERKQLEQQLNDIHRRLEEEVRKRTAELVQTNSELRREIVDRRNFELALRESEHRFRRLTEATFEGIVFIDKGIIIDANEQAARMFSANLIDGLGRPILNFVAPEYREYIKDRLAANYEYPSEFLGLKANGEKFPLEGRMKVIEQNGKKITVSILRDISKRKKAEAEINKYRLHLEELINERTMELAEVNALLEKEIVKQKEAERRVQEALSKEQELNELKSRFISVASHEFRTPLTTILASADLLDLYGREWTSEKIKNFVGKIQDSALYMTQLINDVLLVNRNEAPQVISNPEPADLYELAEILFENEKLTAIGKLDFSFDYKPSKKLYCIDTKLVTQILTNIISNAVKYSPNGGEVSLTIDEFDGYLSFVVTDKGIGISDEDMGHLFEPFYRGKNVGNISGTGLGLSIARKSAEIHNGNLSIESRLNRGTTVSVFIKSSLSGLQ